LNVDELSIVSKYILDT